MPPLKDGGKNRNIRDFFKPFTIPKSRIPIYDVVEEEIVLAPPRPPPSCDAPWTEKPTPSPRKDKDNETLEDSLLLQSSPLSSALTVCSPSPTELTPRPQEDAQPTLPQMDGVNETTSISPSPSNSQRRVPAAVEVPSPKLSDVAKASFSSISSFTSVPLSTQSSSRRIVKNGMHVVTNSDSGSAGSSSSSSSSGDELEDVSAFVPRKRPRLDTAMKDTDRAVNTVSTVKRSMRQIARVSGHSDRSSGISTPQREITPPKAVYKHSLLNMARQREKEQKVEMKMRQMEAEFEEGERLREEESRHDGHGAGGKQAVLADDSDDGERMRLAMQRTESMADREELFFFQGVRDDLVCPTLEAKASGDGSHIWARKLQDEKWREQACLSGFLAELVAEHGLPQFLRDWLAYQLLHESREDLCEAYVSALEAGEEIKGADASATLSFGHFYVLHKSSAVQAKTGDSSPGSMRQQPRAFSHVIRSLRHFTVQAGDDSIAPFVLELMYAAIDATVRSDASLQCVIADSIEYLLDSAHDEEKVAAQISASLTTSQICTPLKCRAIINLPGCSDRSHALRRRLALQLICSDHLAAPSLSTLHVDAILDRLRNAPELQVSEATDYIHLNSLISVLDIAIDSGFMGHSVTSPASIQAPTGRKKVSFADRSTSASSREMENAFNAQIDSFVRQVSLMSSRIKDAGTTHLHRTETKHAIERLAKRLEYGVRTKPRPRKTTFGGMAGGLQRTFLSGFLNGADASAGHALHVSSAKTLESNETDVAEAAVEAIAHDGG